MESQKQETNERIIAALAELPPEALIDEAALAKIFDRCAKSIKRAVRRGELPRPVKLFGKPTWTVRALRRHNLDEANVGLRLDESWTKNRRSGFQPLPEKLVKELAAFADSGVVPNLYQQLAVRFTYPPDALLVVPSHAVRWFDKDLQRAGIAKTTAEGRLDFHALRVGYVSLLVESGGSVKEAQHLARHAKPELTMNRYARTPDARLGELVENIGNKVLPANFCATSVHLDAGALESLERKYLPEQTLAHAETGRGLCPFDTGPGPSCRHWDIGRPKAMSSM